MSPIILNINATSPRTEIVIGNSDDNDHRGNTIVSGIIDGTHAVQVAPVVTPTGAAVTVGGSF